MLIKKCHVPTYRNSQVNNWDEQIKKTKKQKKREKEKRGANTITNLVILDIT